MVIKLTTHIIRHIVGHILAKTIAVLLILNLTMSEAVLAQTETGQSHTLSVTSGINPITMEGEAYADVLKNNFAFIYLNEMVGLILEHFGVETGEDFLKYIVEDSLSKIKYDRFLSLNSISKKDGVFRIFGEDKQEGIEFTASYSFSEKDPTKVISRLTAEKKEQGGDSNSSERSSVNPGDGYIARGRIAVKRAEKDIQQRLDLKRKINKGEMTIEELLESMDLEDDPYSGLKITEKKKKELLGKNLLSIIDMEVDLSMELENIKKRVEDFIIMMKEDPKGTQKEIERAIERLSSPRYYTGPREHPPLDIDWNRKKAHVEHEIMGIAGYIAEKIRSRNTNEDDNVLSCLAVHGPKAKRVIPAQIITTNDFWLGMGKHKEADYFSEELIRELEEKLKEEYILHEFLCDTIGHVEARIIQAVLYPENYFKKKPEGLLREEFASLIKERTADIRKALAKKPQMLISGETDKMEQLEISFAYLKNNFISSRPEAPVKNVDFIERSFNAAKEYHGEKCFDDEGRELYLEHVLSVAEYLERIGADAITICAALLHKVPKKIISDKMRFLGQKDCKGLVGMVARLDKISDLAYSSRDIQGEDSLQNYMNMVAQMASDPNDDKVKDPREKFGYRTMLLVFADKIKTLRSASSHERPYVYDEILHIYAPLAERLELTGIATELRSEVLKISDPEMYRWIETEALNHINMESYEKAQRHLDEVAKLWLGDICSALDLGEVNIKSRIKSGYSIYEKLSSPELAYTYIKQLPDINGIMAIIEDPITAAVNIKDYIENLGFPVIMKIHQERIKGYEARHIHFAMPDKRKYELMIMDNENYRRYKYGTMYKVVDWNPKPHWIYNLEREEAIKHLEPRFVPDEIEYKGDIAVDYEQFLRNIEDKVYVQYVFSEENRRLLHTRFMYKIIEMPSGLNPIDIAAHTQVDTLGRGYPGFFKIKSRSGIKNINFLVEGVIDLKENQKVKRGDIVRLKGMEDDSRYPWRNPLQSSELRKIIEKTSFVRTKLTAFAMNNRQAIAKGKKKIREGGIFRALDAGLKRKKVSFAKKGKEHKVILLKEKEHHSILSEYAKYINLADADELYSAVANEIVNIEDVRNFIETQSFRVFEIYASNLRERRTSIIEKIKSTGFKIHKTETLLSSGSDEDNIGIIRISIMGPLNVTSHHLLQEIMKVKGVKTVRLLFKSVSGKSASTKDIKEGKKILSRSKICQGLGNKLESVLKTFIRENNISDIETLYSDLGLKIIGIRKIEKFIATNRVECKFTIMTEKSESLGVVARIMGVFVNNDFVIKISPSTEGVEKGELEFTGTFPAHIPIKSLSDKVRSVRGVKKVVAKPIVPSTSKAHRFPRIINGKDLYAGLKDQLAEAGYSEGRSKDVIKNGIYRVNSQGQIEQEDDEIIEIVRRTLSGILSRDITFQDMKEAIVDNHEKIHGIIKDGDIERFRTELVHLLGTEKYDDLLLYYQHMYGEYDNSQKLLEELVVNYFMEKALESEIRLLPDKKSIERMTLRSFDEGIGYLIENMFWEKLNEIGYYGSLSEKIGKRFGKYIARKAFIFSRKKENNVILIGLESSWIDKDQMPYIQELFNQLTRIYKEKGLGNIIIKRENGENLAKTLSNEIEDRKVPLSNVIILGSKSVLKADAFNDLRRPDSSGSSAFFAGIELPQDFPKNSHIRILDMIRLSMALALDKAAVSDNPFIEVRANKDGSYTFIPRAEPLDYGLLKTMYKAQLVAMMAA